MKSQRLLQVRALVLIFFLSVFIILYMSPSINYETIRTITIHKTEYYSDAWKGYSVKPVAYVFPQFYAFSENDKIWGTNFTEWDNVRKVTHNIYGLETIRPHESIGYYDGLDLDTRKRQARYLQDSGFYGAAYHHYWFAGKPVMDGVLQRMLLDGEPNIPFMLSWANEPWTARWDGEDSSKIYIAQKYGLIEEWRAHFDWLLAFFRHPNYIRSNGRVQFVVYKPAHAGKAAPPMFAAWRQWAHEEGLGGIDIIETRWGGGGWAGEPPDAMNEFHPHIHGFDHSRFSSTKKNTQVYHRGSLVCWDSTPRHSLDLHNANSQPLCHPKTWKWHMVEMMQRIKADPNPIGSENFLFVNALNEWGEGNALEPSKQFGDGYGKAMREAVSISERDHVWRIDFIASQAVVNNVTRAREKNGTATDVCVLVQTYGDHAEDRIYKLSSMLNSLQKQDNPNWRAIVYQSDSAQYGSETLAFWALDVRIKVADVPAELRAEDQTLEASYPALDWVMKRLSKIDPLCASAQYLLFADGGNTYAPHAFDEVAAHNNPGFDIYGLNVESQQTIRNTEEDMAEEMVWHERCAWIERPETVLCHPSLPNEKWFDLSATFFRLKKFRDANITFTGLESSHLLPERLTTEESWSYVNAVPTSSSFGCQLFHNPAYSSCIQAGKFWFDSPHWNEAGCYTVEGFKGTFGFDHKLIDLIAYRQNGLCLKYTSTRYSEVLDEIREEEAEERERLGLPPVPVHTQVEKLDYRL